MQSFKQVCLLRLLHVFHTNIFDRQLDVAVQLMPCPFTGPKMFWAAGPHFLRQAKNLFTYYGSQKHFMPDKKMICTVKLGNKERVDKEQIGIKEPFPVTNLPFTS